MVLKALCITTVRVSAFVLTACVLVATDYPLVIYGEQDDRHELCEQRAFGKSWEQGAAVALMVEKKELSSPGVQDQKRRFYTKSMEERYNVCPGERFAKQQTAGLCTAFLVRGDLVVTAGHCLARHDNCKDFAFIFDWRLESTLAESKEQWVEERKIYSCKKVEYLSTQEEGKIDLAVLRLEKKVVNRAPLKLEPEAQLFSLSSFYMIGHPLGLPQKISFGGGLLDNFDTAYFATDLDSYSINSGSPVFNEKTGLVQGVLIRGQEDFEERGGCSVSSVCKGSICLGEEVLRSSVVSQVLASLAL